ncbi:hypothetical protein C1646_691853 [Rhizophagus diaphanus]|nr:hypothetical protein C1646_691853 [Rhizophagus diaphanus] [Rhizophagus sp. MUCL 43196]
MFLLYKLREYKYCKVIKCTEEYTSKTCGHCGQINGKLGGDGSGQGTSYSNC